MSEKNLQLSFFLILLAIVLVLLFFTFLPYLGVLVLAATFAVVFSPVYKKLLKLMSGNEGLAAFTATFFVVVVILVPLSFFGFEVLHEARGLYERLTTGNATGLPLTIVNFLKERLDLLQPFFALDLGKYLGQIFGSIARNFSSIFATLSRVTIGLVVCLFALYYLFKDGHKLAKKLITLSPLTDRDNREILKRLEATINAVVRGSLIVAVIQGVLAGLGFWIFGVSSPALWGSLVVVASLVPAIGSALVTIPAGLYLFFSGDIAQGLGLLAWSTLLVGTIDNFLRPKLIQRNINLHPFFILLSAIGGISLFGPIGFLLGPLILSLFFALLDLYPQFIQEKTEQRTGGVSP